jgi:hypothetical protein
MNQCKFKPGDRVSFKRESVSYSKDSDLDRLITRFNILTIRTVEEHATYFYEFLTFEEDTTNSWTPDWFELIPEEFQSYYTTQLREVLEIINI